jgi:hypothetical protein
MTDGFSFQPIIIIGAPRSGTNLLRDLLTSFPGVVTWPCDEINPLWRRHNTGWPDDALPAALATPKVRRSIRRAFASRARRGGVHTVVEKTCANSLRVDFVERTLPEARYIHIVRDGRDAVASALQRWSAPLDLKYSLKKARFVPLAELPYYAVRFAGSRCRRLLGRQRGRRSWGPRFPDIDRWLATEPLADVAADQWRQCVLLASHSLLRLPASRVAHGRYESLVARPAAELSRLLRFAKIPYHSDQLARAVRGVSVASVGRWRAALDAQIAARLTPSIEDTLRLISARDVQHETAA